MKFSGLLFLQCLLVTLLFLGACQPLIAADVSFHGDFNHCARLYTNQAAFFTGDFAYKTTRTAAIAEETSSDSFALFKYRLWTEVISDDGRVKGVYALEVGKIHFGDSDDGGGFSGDGVNVETRWAYTELALADSRVRIGLQPIRVNSFFWKETATGVHFRRGALEAAWYRGYEDSAVDSSSEDMDACYLRYTFQPYRDCSLGMFGVWITSDGLTRMDVVEKTAAGETVPAIRGNYLKKMTGYDLDLFTFGLDGVLKYGNLSVSWDFLAQGGDFAEAEDFRGYFLHAMLEYRLGAGTLSYRFWYASGDKDDRDGSRDAYIAVDCDIVTRNASVVLFEGMVEDNCFSSVPYIQDKGLILNRLGYEQRVTDRLTTGGALLYLMTAEKVEYEGYADDRVGVELDLFANYKLSRSLELGIEAGYLFAGDAMDYYEVDNNGKADTDLFVVNTKIRYKF